MSQARGLSRTYLSFFQSFSMRKMSSLSRLMWDSSRYDCRTGCPSGVLRLSLIRYTQSPVQGHKGHTCKEPGLSPAHQNQRRQSLKQTQQRHLMLNRTHCRTCQGHSDAFHSSFTEKLPITFHAQTENINL